MKQFEMAQRLHQELDSKYAAQLFRASARGQIRAMAKNLELRRLNDGAYYLIIFATFEKDINDRVSTAKQRWISKPAYHQRRPWESIPERAHFKDKVRAVLDQREPLFTVISDYYEIRNQLAHKGMTTKTFSIPSVVNDLKMARKLMKR